MSDHENNNDSFEEVKNDLVEKKDEAQDEIVKKKDEAREELVEKKNEFLKKLEDDGVSVYALHLPFTASLITRVAKIPKASPWPEQALSSSPLFH